MGASSEMAIQMQEQENSQYYGLIGRMQRKEETLSYSSLKEFGKSPRNFIAYKLKERREQTESQKFGSLCDCLLTEPENFDELFSIVDNTPTTDNQSGFCNDLIAGIHLDVAFSNNYSRGKALELFAQFEPYILAAKEGKTVITSKLKEEAEKLTSALKQSPIVAQYLDACTSFQNKKEWEYKGWKFKGFTDCEGHNLIIDLKFTANADPDAFERYIMKYDYFMQMGMYAEAHGGLPECFFICYDKTGNFSVIKLDYTLINYGTRKYQYLVEKLNQCIQQNRWSESFNFFDVQLRTAYKPKWVKGFETDLTED